LSPLLVDIGPGTFNVETESGDILRFCNGGGHVTFRGSGQDITTLGGVGFPMGGLIPFVVTYAVIHVTNCDNLTFEDLTIASTSAAVIGVGWNGGGASVWSNIHIKSGYWSWIDVCTSSGTTGVHKWFGSSLESVGGGATNSAYQSRCATNIIHGSELVAMRAGSDNALLSKFTVVEAIGKKADIQLYGSSVKAVYANTATSPSYVTNSIIGISAANNAAVHMHGGVISVRSERPEVTFNVIGALASNNGMIHIIDTAFGLLSSGNGLMQRLVNNGGSIMSPFQWQSGSEPPMSSAGGHLISLHGSDSFIETDCDTAGLCTNVPATSQQPHLMVYSANCNTNGPWFDATTNACRL
jgi:hypothetical protein